MLKQSGFPEGRGFPVVKLIVNRNDQQRVVAEAVAAMWRSVLRIETEIVVKSWEDYEAIYKAGDYDLVRRSLVMQTTDETTNMLLMFGVGEEETADEVSGNEEEQASLKGVTEELLPKQRMKIRVLGKALRPQSSASRTR